MKKIVILVIGAVLLGSSLGVAQSADKVTNTRILQATKDTTVTYVGVKVFVPAGQTVILGQTDGAVVLRGQKLAGVKIGEGTLTVQGPVFLTVQPDTQVIRVVEGNKVLITDANGRTAEVSGGAAVSAKDIRLDVVPPTQKVTVVGAEQVVVKTRSGNSDSVVAEGNEVPQELPAFVAATSTSSLAAEQAAFDVEDSLSPSVP